MDRDSDFVTAGVCPHLIGIDIGGTYTDFVVLRNGTVELRKVLSTPDDPSQGALHGLKELAPEGFFEIIHGSTVATNATLERRGARTVLVTTKGFADVLKIGRQTRSELYALKPSRPEPLISGDMTIELDERVNAAGEVEMALGDGELDRLFRFCRRKNAESIAVSFLFSFLSDGHEKAVAAHREAGRYAISLSSEILCEFREYERTCTTALNAYVAPVMMRYLEKLGHAVSSMGAERLWIMQSHGGVFSSDQAARRPVHTILSGPAGGVLGALHVSKEAGFDEILTIDMGGTSTDVSLCEGELPLTREGSIESYPVRIPLVDIHTIGSGGGSIAFVDEGGALRVGPRSAGADPGPACFGKGEQITVTDALLILGRLPEGEFMASRRAETNDRSHHGSGSPTSRHLDYDRALRFIKPLAQSLGMSVMDAAWGIIQVVQAQMEGALRVVSVQRGYDPRRFTLVAFGGGGPLHACELANLLEIPRVMIPRCPGVLSALGMVVAPRFMEFSRTLRMSLDEITGERLRTGLEPLMKRAEEELGCPAGMLTVEPSLDMRYRGQSFELTVRLLSYERDDIEASFLALHRKRYGYTRTEGDIEVVNFRLKAGFPGHQTAQSQKAAAEKCCRLAPVQRTIQVWGREKESGPMQASDAVLLNRSVLTPGSTFSGPAVITQYDCTAYIPGHWSGYVDENEHVIVEKR
ncbi:MAG: hydantoinase/oxoprolinase family protein [Candidatus Xenobiia bacterium LiM19]